MALSLLLVCALAAPPVGVDALSPIRSRIEIGDYDSALQEAAVRMGEAPNRSDLRAAYVIALARQGSDRLAYQAYLDYLRRFPEEPRPVLLEEVCWSTLQAGARDQTFLGRLAALLGAVMAHEAPAVKIVLAGLRSPSGEIRLICAELAAELADASLQDELLRIMREDRNSEVRAEAIRSIGKLEIEEVREELKERLARSHLSIEEQEAAIGAILSMTDRADVAEIEQFACHERAAMRRLACECIARFDLCNEKWRLILLLGDTRADVRTAALSSLGLLRVEGVVDRVRPLLADPDPMVAITASWVVALYEPEEGMAALEQWLSCESRDWSRRAAAAVAATGGYGVPLAKRVLQCHPDPYVRANVALGLIGQRVETERAAEEVYQLLGREKGKWMWDDEKNPLFRAVVPSRERHQETIPNYPEAVNQVTRLELLSILAAAGHPGAGERMREMLGERKWGVTGIAAVTLLEEGDEVGLELVRTLLDDQDPAIRVQAALALAIWGCDPSAVTTLHEAYEEADRDLKITILEGIGRIGEQESLPFLIERLGDPFQTVRLFAASALLQCMGRSGSEGLQLIKKEKS